MTYPLLNVTIQPDEEWLVESWIDLLEDRTLRALLRLSPRRRTCLILYYLLRESYDEIAQSCNISRERVRQIVSRATSILRFSFSEVNSDRDPYLNDLLQLPIVSLRKTRRPLVKEPYLDIKKVPPNMDLEEKWMLWDEVCFRTEECQSIEDFETPIGPT